MIIKRLRVFPGIHWRYETIVDVYLDTIVDLTTFPHYTSVSTPSQRVRGRSVPTHRLDMDIPDNLDLEPESVMEPGRSGAAPPSESTRRRNVSSVVSIFFYCFIYSQLL